MSISNAAPRIAILGRDKDIVNYIHFLSQSHFIPVPTRNPGEAASCDGLLLPGGDDITPGFFGEHNKGSRKIDTELDILQFQALELCIRHRLPVLGICKGMQLINVAFGGTIVQDMTTSRFHAFNEKDQYHPVQTVPDCCFRDFWGSDCMVNSAHHQCIAKTGKNLRVVQRCPLDNCPEALIHQSLPIWAVQWHPERLDGSLTDVEGAKLLSIFL